MNRSPMIKTHRFAMFSRKLAVIFAAAVIQHSAAQAQQTPLPNAPATRLFAAVLPESAPQAAMPGAPQSSTSSAGPSLTLAQAEQMAIRNNPNISVARLLALAQAQVTREVRSGGNADGNRQPDRSGRAREQPHHRWTAQQPFRLQSRGRRPHGEPAHHRLRPHAQPRPQRAIECTERNSKANAPRSSTSPLQSIKRFIRRSPAQAVLKVAQQTVAQRQDTVDQVCALTKAKIRSDLDSEFCRRAALAGQVAAARC